MQSRTANTTNPTARPAHLVAQQAADTLTAADVVADEVALSHEDEAGTLVAGADTLAEGTKVDLSVALRAVWAVTLVPWAQGRTWVEWACQE